MKESEMKLLLLVLDNPKFVDDLMLEVKSKHISFPLARKIYEWIEEQYLNGDRIGTTKCLIDLDIADKINKFSFDLFPSDFRSYIDIVKKNHARRKIKEAGSKLTELSQATNGSSEEFKRKAQETVFDELSFDDERETLHKIDEALEQSFQALVEIEEDGEQGLDTGYYVIKKKIGGLEPGHVTVLAAQTSVGKTAFALNVAHNVLLDDKKVLVFTLEMSAKEVADRLLIMDSLVDASHFQMKLDEGERKNVDAAASRLCDKNLWVDERKGLSAVEIMARAKKVQQKEGQLDLIIVDYLQMMRHPGDDNFARAVGESCNRLKELAGELKVPIILISQLNREVKGTPRLKHLRDSGRIEEFADEVWFLFREEYEEEALTGQVVERQRAELIMAKGRTKGIGHALLYWYPKFQKFRDGYIEEIEGPLEHGIIGEEESRDYNDHRPEEMAWDYD